MEPITQEKNFPCRIMQQSRIENPLLSVIIPVYNAKDYLEECIRSVLEQKIEQMEIICVDDGSTDTSLEILCRCGGQDPRFTLLSQRNYGQSVARNNGLTAAKGKYIYFMDDDDLLKPEALGPLLQKMEENKLDLIYFNTLCFADELSFEDEVKRKRSYYKRTHSYPEVYKGADLMREFRSHKDYINVVWLQITRKKFLEEQNIAFYPGITHEDNLFVFTTLLFAERAAYDNRQPHQHRLRKNSIVTTPETFKNIYGRFITFLEMRKILSELSLSEENYKAAFELTTDLLHYTAQRYTLLPQEEKERVANLSAREQLLFKFYILDHCLKTQKTGTLAADTLHISLITDKNYVKPTATAIYSLIKNKNRATKLFIHVVTADISAPLEPLFERLSGLDQNVTIEVVKLSASQYDGLHEFKANEPCVASVAALLKFELPLIFPQLDTLLYLDGDIIVRRDLQDLYRINIEEQYAAVSVDSGVIYYAPTQEYLKRVEHYFNSGVMLLNLKKMRAEKVTERLIREKQASRDSMLMDQNAFNIVFDGHIKCIPPIYNFLYVNLVRAAKRYTIADLNALYGTGFKSLQEAADAAVIIHYSSKDKPWKYRDVPLGGEWLHYYREMQELCGDTLVMKEKTIWCANPPQAEDGSPLQTDRPAPVTSLLCKQEAPPCGQSVLNTPKVSVLIPVYNTEKYVSETLDCLCRQTLKEIEIICVNDGSTDGSLAILKAYAAIDKRIRVITQGNRGVSAARNHALQYAGGEYIYFLDSDDLLEKEALENLYATARENRLDMLLFGGSSFYENQELEAAFPIYKTYYAYKYAYRDVRKGTDLYPDLIRGGDYKVCVPQQFFSREFLKQKNITFLEGLIYEDNLFTLEALLQAHRVMCSPRPYRLRRVRENSIMTSAVNFTTFNSHFLILVAMYRYILQHRFPPKVVEAAQISLKNFSKITGKLFHDLPIGEQHTPIALNHKDDLLAELLFLAIKSTKQASEHSLFQKEADALRKQLQTQKKEADALCKQLQTREKEITTIKRGYSFRIGRILTFLPRKLRGGFRCYKEHGFMYTVKRTLWHLGVK